jgi:hypothetical protein
LRVRVKAKARARGLATEEQMLAKWFGAVKH